MSNEAFTAADSGDSNAVATKQPTAPNGEKKPIESDSKTTATEGKRREYLAGKKGTEAEGFKKIKTAQKLNTDNFKKMPTNMTGKKVKTPVENIEKFGKVGKAAIGALALGDRKSVV